jgi:hypothetical protein
MAPPITYDVDGTQYVAFGGGIGRAAAVVGPTDGKTENPPVFLVFKLGGTAPMPEKVETPAPAAPEGPAPEQRN